MSVLWMDHSMRQPGRRSPRPNETLLETARWPTYTYKNRKVSRPAMTRIDFPRIYSRERWNARPAGPMTEQATPIEAFIHHSADPNAKKINTLREQCAHMRGVQDYHMNGNGWSDIGYHYVVFQWLGSKASARIFAARQASFIPAAQAGHNNRTLAVCVVGHGARDPMERNTRFAIEQIIRSYPSVARVGGHRDVTPTECPGDKFYHEVPTIAAAVNRKTF